MAMMKPHLSPCIKVTVFPDCSHVGPSLVAGYGNAMGVGALVGLEAKHDGPRSPLDNNKREEQKTRYSSHVGSEVIAVIIAVVGLRKGEPVD